MKNLLKYLAKHLKSFRRSIVILLITLASVSYLQFLQPQIIKNVIDKAIPYNDKKLLVILVITYLLFTILLGVFNYVNSILMVKISQSSITKLRNELFNHILSQDYAFFEDAKTGDLMTRLNTDIRSIQSLISTQSLSFITNSIQFVVILVFMFMMDFKLSLLVSLSFPLVYFLNKSFTKKMRQNYRKLRTLSSQMSNHLQTSLSSMELIKNFNTKELHSEDYENLNELSLQQNIRVSSLSAKLSPVISFVNTLAISSVWLYGALKVMDNTFSIGDITAYLSYLSMAQAPIRSFAGLANRFEEAKVSFERIEEILQVTPDITDHKDAVIFSPGDIKFNNVSFAYKTSNEVLKNINLRIKENETTALVGSSGSGKTSLIKLVSRLYEPTKGKITINDIDLDKIKIKSLRDKIAIVSQDIILLDGTIKENIIYGQDKISHEELERACANAEILDFINSLDDKFDTQIGERGIKLSGGQKQRIALARIFLKDADIIILDEATAALDNKTEKAIQETLDRLTQNKTTLVIAHRLSTIANADTIYVLEDGEISESGNHQELLNQNGVYAELYNSQFK